LVAAENESPIQFYTPPPEATAAPRQCTLSDTAQYTERGT